MKILITFLASLLLGCFGQEFYYEPALNVNDNREINAALKDMRSMSIIRIKPGRKAVENTFELTPSSTRTMQEEVVEVAPDTQVSYDNQFLYDSQQKPKTDETDRNHIKKIADQLNVAQKHFSVLSEHQKYILSQDPLVKSYVFGNQERQTKSKVSRSKYTEQDLQYKSQKKTKAASTSSSDDTATKEKGNPFTTTSTNDKGKEFTQADNQSTEELQYITITKSPKFVNLQDLNRVSPEAALDHTGQPHNLKGLESVEISQMAATSVANPIPQFDFGKYETFPIYQMHGKNDHDHRTPKYEFLYNVRDFEGNSHFGHMESRSDETTYGKYFVQLPDGRLETVNYWADDTGYHANVEYLRRAIYPQRY